MRLDKKKTIMFNEEQILKAQEIVKRRAAYGYTLSDFIREAVAEKIDRELEE